MAGSESDTPLQVVAVVGSSVVILQSEKKTSCDTLHS